MKTLNDFSSTDGVWFKESDIKKIRMMDNGVIHVLSTVCPDYSNDGQIYTFCGVLGSEISLTAQEHLKHIPGFIDELRRCGFIPEWKILVADLPELVESQKEFFQKVSGSRDEYLSRCAGSACLIQKKVGGMAIAQTFSEFYGKSGLGYLKIQEEVTQRIRQEGEVPPFRSKFRSFVAGRAGLAQRFRGRRLSEEEILQAGAHGMSLYVTHGTLLRKLFSGTNLVVINHQTTNLQNFYLCNFVSGYEDLLNTPKFPLGILKKELY